MCEADFCGEDAGTYYARKDFEVWKKMNGWGEMKNHLKPQEAGREKKTLVPKKTISDL